MGDHHAGHAHALEDIDHFKLHTVAQLFIQRAHRLIKQQQFRAFCQAAGQGHALALAAGELVRLTLRELLHVHQAQHLGHARGNFSLRQLILLQAKGDILLHRHMREQRVGLEHHVDRALIRRHAGEVHAVEHDLPGGGLFKTGQHTQQGRFTTARGPQKGKNFAFIDRQADVVHGMLAIERFGEVTNFKQRGQRFTDFRLRAGDRVIHGVFSGRDQIMVQAHQNGAPVAGGASLARPVTKGYLPLFTLVHARVRTRSIFGSWTFRVKSLANTSAGG